MTGPPRFSGILEIDPKRFGFVREISHGMAREQHDPFVPPSLISQFQLRPGVVIEGTVSPSSGKRNSRESRSPQVASIETVNGLTPDVWRELTEFSRHEVVSPHQLIRLEGRGSNISARIVELFCPVGRGQRALLVSPPKAGKTMLMQQLAHAISLHNPDVVLLVLLIDERPEEVTDMRRSIKGEVFASSSDSERGDHVRLAQLILEYAKRKVETGADVVIMMDSLTRMGRAFNVHQKSSGRTMSGGVDIRALEIPKRLFGAARNIETGGSLTIIATALIETNSRMDDLIFQEFKGTGNMELVLDRGLADERLFPAINLGQSGTRREELLFGPAAQQHQALRRSIARLSPREAMLTVQKLIAQFPTNAELLARF
ncbi:MAG: transcription termination factor Rho [Ignavibacteria bacterium]|nr:transcription termination factor Rho [Ignavibacteria bacterium]